MPFRRCARAPAVDAQPTLCVQPHSPNPPSLPALPAAATAAAATAAAATDSSGCALPAAATVSSGCALPAAATVSSASGWSAAATDSCPWHATRDGRSASTAAHRTPSSHTSSDARRTSSGCTLSRRPQRSAWLRADAALCNEAVTSGPCSRATRGRGPRGNSNCFQHAVSYYHPLRGRARGPREVVDGRRREVVDGRRRRTHPPCAHAPARRFWWRRCRTSSQTHAALSRRRSATCLPTCAR